MKNAVTWRKRSGLGEAVLAVLVALNAAAADAPAASSESAANPAPAAVNPLVAEPAPAATTTPGTPPPPAATPAGATPAGAQPAETPAALFARGEALLAAKEYEAALECYDGALKLQPDLDLLRRTIERKYQIGLDYLQGKASRYFLGFIPYSSPAFGVKILDELVHDFPYEGLSDDALYSIANHYAQVEDWEEARPVYERLIESYPKSEFVPVAYLQLGKAIYHSIKGYRYDPTPIVKARWHFERYLEKREVGREAKEAREYIQELKDMEARYELYVARFYLSDDNPRGAKIHLSAAVRKGKGLDGLPTAAAKEAEEELKSLSRDK